VDYPLLSSSEFDEWSNLQTKQNTLAATHYLSLVSFPHSFLRPLHSFPHTVFTCNNAFIKCEILSMNKLITSSEFDHWSNLQTKQNTLAATLYLSLVSFPHSFLRPFHLFTHTVFTLNNEFIKCEISSMNKLITSNQHSPHLRFYMKDLLWVLIFTSMAVSCKIFEHFALQVDPVIGFIQPGSTPFKDSTILAPKLADPPFWWKSNSTPPPKSGSS
jgi:hypothetical protein